MNESRALARFAATSRWEDFPREIRHETIRTFVNWIGNPIWGSRDIVVERLIAALDPLSGPRSAALLGRSERLDPLKAAFLNCTASGIADYDDTHLASVIHPTGPAASALLALVGTRRVSGRDFLHALALGIEVECRVANALAPKASTAWYMTGVVGGLGAAVAAGRILGLDEDRMLAALALAAARAAGPRETHGTMAKSLVAGFAAEEGLAAAFMAERGVEAPTAPIEGPRGLAVLVAPGADLSKLASGLGDDFELMRNAYKPFPCGIVIHAALTGALELAREHKPDPVAIEAVRLTVHPLCLELCGRRAPADAVEGSFSVYHWVAVALTKRAAGIRQFADDVVRDPAISALRARVEAKADAALRKDEAIVEVALRDGRVLRRHVEHALGAIERPPSDAELSQKLADCVAERLPADAGRRLAEICWRLDNETDAAAIVRAATGEAP